MGSQLELESEFPNYLIVMEIHCQKKQMVMTDMTISDGNAWHSLREVNHIWIYLVGKLIKLNR